MPATSRAEDLAEAEEFLRWLADDHFTFVGSSTYELETDEAGETQLRRIKGTGLGILRGHDDGTRSPSFAELPAEVRARAREAGAPGRAHQGQRRAAPSTAPPISTMSASSASAPMAWSWASTASWASSPPPPTA